MSILIKNANAYINNEFQKTNIFIMNGCISYIGDKIDDIQTETIIDATEKLVIPGLVDMHVHFREPGYEYSEDIHSGSCAAASGGFTHVACMPNTKPSIDNAQILKELLNKINDNAVVNVMPIAAITINQEGKQLTEMAELKNDGAVAVSDDGRPVESARMMSLAMKYASNFDLPVISHCEDLDIAKGGVMNEGYYSTILGMPGISSVSEELMVAREILLSQAYDLPIHIAHISTKGTVELIRNAKRNGAKVTCETCPHYFSLDESCLTSFDTNYKMNPPLRTPEDVQAIKDGIKDGTIDIIVTDHAPHHIDSKNVEFEYANNGIVGLETSLPLVITNLVNQGYLTYEDLVEKMSVKPMEILKQNNNAIAMGNNANITIFDPNADIIVDKETFKSKSKNTPFDKFELKGKVNYTIVNGEIVYDNGNIIGE